MRYDLLSPKPLRAELIKELGEFTEDGKRRVPVIRQVQRWITGETPMPGWAREVTDRIVMGETPKRAASSMTRRLLAGVMALERDRGIDDAAIAEMMDRVVEYEQSLAEQVGTEADARFVAELKASRRRSAERRADRTGGQSGASQGNTKQKP